MEAKRQGPGALRQFENETRPGYRQSVGELFLCQRTVSAVLGSPEEKTAISEVAQNCFIPSAPRLSHTPLNKSGDLRESYATVTQTPLSSVPSTLVRPSSPHEIPEINNPGIQLAGCLGSPSHRFAPHTALAVWQGPTWSNTAVKMHHPARGFHLKKGQVTCSKKVQPLRE